MKSLSRIFHLIPETIILMSEEGTVCIPDDHGKFDLMNCSAIKLREIWLQ